MLELLNTYSVEEILIFIVFLGLAIKGVVDFWDWLVQRLRQAFNKEATQQENVKSLQARLDQSDALLQHLSIEQDKLQEQLQQMSAQVSLLLDSDMDDIKSFITKEHHFYCYDQGWIDDYSLNCIEQRYSHYVEEGGNSFIHTFMKEIRELPKVSPDKQE